MSYLPKINLVKYKLGRKTWNIKLKLMYVFDTMSDDLSDWPILYFHKEWMKMKKYSKWKQLETLKRAHLLNPESIRNCQ